MDETYIRVGASGAISDLAITGGGQTLDFYLSPKRNVAVDKRSLARAIAELKEMEAMHSLRKGQGTMFAHDQPNPDAVIVSRGFETA